MTVLLLLGAFAGGCAYFNLFYNAEQAFEQAEDLGREVDPRNQPTSQQRTQYQRAIQKCELLLEEYPESGLVDDALYLMGKSHLRLEEWSDALRAFDNLLANFPRSEHVEEVMYLKSLAHFGRGEEQLGLEWFSRLREAYPEGKFGPEALRGLGDAYAEDGRPDQAERYYREYLERYPNRGEVERVQLSLAHVLFDQGHYEDAVQTLQQIDFDHAEERVAFEARLLLVSSLVELGRIQEARAGLDALDAAALLPGEQADATLMRGRVELLDGDETAGVKTLKGLVAEYEGRSTATDAQQIIVEYYLREQGPEGEDLRRELALSLEGRPSGDAAQVLRQLDRRLQVYDELRAAFAESDSGGTDVADSLAARAAFSVAEMLLFDFERPRDALDWYRESLARDPDSPLAPRALYAMAWIEGEKFHEQVTSEALLARLRQEYPESVQARALRGEQFTAPRPRSREEIEALVASRLGGGVVGTGGAVGSAVAHPDDPRWAPDRSLRFGGPGALVPRERNGR